MTVAIAEPPRRGEDRGNHDRVRVQHPRHRRETCIVEREADIRVGNVDDEKLQARQERRREHDQCSRTDRLLDSLAGTPASLGSWDRSVSEVRHCLCMDYYTQSATPALGGGIDDC